MIYWPVDCKEPVNLHDDDVTASTDEGKDTEKVVIAIIFHLSSFEKTHLQNNSKNSISRSDANSYEIVDLENMNRFNLAPVIVISDERQDDVDDNH